jgi:thiamine transport system permease protein
MLNRSDRRIALAGGGLTLASLLAFCGLAIVALFVSGADAGTGNIWFDPYIWRITRFTLWQAGLSTALSIGLGGFLAIALSRQQQFYGRIWVIRLMALPMGLPTLIVSFGLIGVWGKEGIINQGLERVGLAEPINIYGISGILLAHVFFNAPLAARLFLAALDKVPAEYWRTASSLGFSWFSVFRIIEGPALRRVLPGISGLIFMLCATSFTLVLILGGGPRATTLEVAIYQALRFDFDLPRAVALCFLQIAITALALLFLRFLQNDDASILVSGKAARRFDGAKWVTRLVDFSVIAAMGLMVLLPLVQVVISGFGADFSGLFTSALFYRAVTTSLVLALCAAILSLLLAAGAIAASAALQRHECRQPVFAVFYGRALNGLPSYVLLVPPVVLGTGWFLLLRGFVQPEVFAPVLVIFINAMMAMPFVTRVLEPAWTEHRFQTTRLAASLGIVGWDRIRLIDWPVLKAPVLTSLSFAMALSLGDLGAVALFGSDSFVTLPWLLFSKLGSYRSADAAGLALILGVLCFVLTLVCTRGQSDMKDTQS